MSSCVDDADLRTFEVALERLLVAAAEDRVPEVFIEGALRDYADDIDEFGRVPRTWGDR